MLSSTHPGYANGEWLVALAHAYSLRTVLCPRHPGWRHRLVLIGREFHQEYGVISALVPSVMTGIVDHSRILDARPFAEQDNEAAFLDFVITWAANWPPGGAGHARCCCWAAPTSTSASSPAMPEHLGVWFTIPYVGEDQLDRATEKDAFYELCRELDIPSRAPSSTTAPRPRRHRSSCPRASPRKRFRCPPSSSPPTELPGANSNSPARRRSTPSQPTPSSRTLSPRPRRPATPERSSSRT